MTTENVNMQSSREDQILFKSLHLLNGWIHWQKADRFSTEFLGRNWNKQTFSMLLIWVKDTDCLKQQFSKIWSYIRQSIIDEAADRWSARLLACVKAEGLQFKHLPWAFSDPTTQLSLFIATKTSFCQNHARSWEEDGVTFYASAQRSVAGGILFLSCSSVYAFRNIVNTMLTQPRVDSILTKLH